MYISFLPNNVTDMYEDHNNYYLILDLVSGGEMFDHLINYGAYSEADAARLMYEIASALAFMHGVGVVYVLFSCHVHVESNDFHPYPFYGFFPSCVDTLT